MGLDIWRFSEMPHPGIAKTEPQPFKLLTRLSGGPKEFEMWAARCNCTKILLKLLIS